MRGASLNRTTLIAFPIALFLAWWMYVVTRAGNGPGFQMSRVSNNAMFAVSILGVVYLVFVVIALFVLYFGNVRGQNVSAGSVLMPALVKFAVCFVLAIALSIPMGEWFCSADERAFRNETQAFLKTAEPNSVTHDLRLYSRVRWWPASSQQLVSDLPKEK
ncbi:MAG: hypothetical protein ABJB66_02860 [Gemmatimonadaceae bacterium]